MVHVEQMSCGACGSALHRLQRVTDDQGRVLALLVSCVRCPTVTRVGPVSEVRLTPTSESPGGLAPMPWSKGGA